MLLCYLLVSCLIALQWLPAVDRLRQVQRALSGMLPGHVTFCIHHRLLDLFTMVRKTLSEVFLELNLERGVRVLDVACGVGNMAEDLSHQGYTNIDGLDPVQGYLDTAKSKGLYKVLLLLLV